MITQYQITSSAWTQITAAGKSGICWLDDDNEEAGDRADVRLWHGSTPDDNSISIARRVIRAKSNNDILSFVASSYTDIYYARCATPGATARLCVESDGIGTQIGISDVSIQDQTSFPIEYYLTNKIQDVTIANPIAIEDHHVNLAAGHGFVVGNFLEIKYIDSVNGIMRHFQGEVTVVNVNQITVMPSLDFNVVLANIVSAKRTNADFAPSAAAALLSPIEFDIAPVDGLSYDITALTVAMILATAGDDGLFGNIPKLANGMYFGAEHKEGAVVTKCFHLANVRDNADFRIYCGPANVVYTTRSGGQGSFGVAAEKQFNGMGNLGVVVRLNSEKERFYVAVHDNLTGITRLRMKVRGHVVED